MDEEARAKRIVTRAAELAGETGAGALVGFFFGGPLGAAAGGLTPLVTTATRKILTEVTNRVLSNREQIRVGKGAWHSLTTIHQRRAEGHLPRNDGFFEEDLSGRSPAEEIFEGVLLKCKNEHEEKKARYIGNIFGNAMFSGASADLINAVLSVAGSLSYRQIRLLAIMGRKSEFGVPRLVPLAAVDSAKGNVEKEAVISELQALGRHELLRKQRSIPCILTNFGQLCFDLVGLDQIPRDELAKLVELSLLDADDKELGYPSD